MPNRLQTVCAAGRLEVIVTYMAEFVGSRFPLLLVVQPRVKDYRIAAVALTHERVYMTRHILQNKHYHAISPL